MEYKGAVFRLCVTLLPPAIVSFSRLGSLILERVTAACLRRSAEVVVSADQRGGPNGKRRLQGSLSEA